MAEIDKSKNNLENTVYRDGTTEAPEVFEMPRTAQEIFDHADELAARFERAEPSDVRDVTALQAVRGAFLASAAAERELSEAVIRARHDGHTWAAIGAMVGTSGEAARRRYGQAISAGTVQQQGEITVPK